MTSEVHSPTLHRHFGLLQATALNITMIVGAGIFVTIPPILVELPGPYALWAWLAAGALILVDGLIWAELGAALPGSGGSYLYLRECYGRHSWGRFMAFLFIWQFLITGPLELATSLIAIGLFSNGVSPDWKTFNDSWTYQLSLVQWQDTSLRVTFGPSRVLGFLVGLVLVWLLYRRIATLGRWTVTFWLGVLAVVAWILVEGGIHFDSSVAFDYSGRAAAGPASGFTNLGAAMILALFAYLGYYNICYIGDEVRDPARTIPRSIMLSALLVCVLYVGLHLAMLGTVPWTQVPTDSKEMDNYNLAADFMERLHPAATTGADGRAPFAWAPVLVSLLLIWSSIGSGFAGLLGYSRIPYGAAHYGHFFAPLARVHPVHHIPHVSLLLVGGLMLFWSFFDLGDVIQALISTRIVIQFIGQVVGVILFRRREPHRIRPYKMWLYPLPCGLALAGWLYVCISAPSLFLILGLATLIGGVGAFLLWSWNR